MATTTDFVAWLDGVEPEGHDEVYSLYRSVQDIDEMGGFKCTKKGSQYFVTSTSTDDTLRLANDKAKSAFLYHVKKTYADSDMDIEGWYAFKHAMGKDD